LKNGVDPIEMRNECDLMKELWQAKPDLIFIQATIIEQADVNVVARVKVDEQLGRALFVVTASRDDGADFAYKIGADAFLPVPHTESQIEAILRHVLPWPKKILLIQSPEDPPTTLYRKLDSAGYSLLAADSGENGIKTAAAESPDLILCSFQLPDMSGLKVCERIKDSKLLNHIPVMILSREWNMETKETCFESGVHQVLRYPFESGENLRIIASVVDAPRKSKKFKALVVDDSPLIREVVAKMFRQIGFFVITAEDGREGLQAAIEESPDIITSDCEMPVMDGYQFCMRLNQDSRTKHIPVIMITARKSKADKEKGRSVGVAIYMTKPFEVGELERRVTQVLVS